MQWTSESEAIARGRKQQERRGKPLSENDPIWLEDFSDEQVISELARVRDLFHSTAPFPRREQKLFYILPQLKVMRGL